MEYEGKYINPYTDYGFKYLFGTEPNKDFTLALINALLQGREQIKSLTLLPAEQLGNTIADRRAVFDKDKDNSEYYHHTVQLMDVSTQARNLKRQGFPIDAITKATGLEPEQVARL